MIVDGMNKQSESIVLDILTIQDLENIKNRNANNKNN